MMNLEYLSTGKHLPSKAKATVEVLLKSGFHYLETQNDYFIEGTEYHNGWVINETFGYLNVIWGETKDCWSRKMTSEQNCNEWEQLVLEEIALIKQLINDSERDSWMSPDQLSIPGLLEESEDS
jgi:hypothetical protein